MTKLKKSLTSTNMILVYVILLFSLAVTLQQPAFLSPATAINLCRSGIFTLCFALCEMLVMIAGGIDISFPAIGCVAMYVPMYLYDKGKLPESGLAFLLVALLCGLLFGLINGLLVSYLKIPSLIATLATSSIAAGGLAFAFGVRDYTIMPDALYKVYDLNLLTYCDPATGMNYPLTGLILVPLVLALLMAWMLRFTMVGRGLYAMGGNLEAARTVGFNVRRLQFFTYIFSGIITAITAVMYVILLHSATTTALMGSEMLVIAACVVGGCSLSCGRGSVIGVVLGTLLITLVQNHLNMLGIDTAWQTFAVGIVLLFGVLMTSLHDRIERRIKQKRV